MTHVKLVLGLAAATLVSAENIVTTLFIPDTDAESLAGSVMGVVSAAHPSRCTEFKYRTLTDRVGCNCYYLLCQLSDRYWY